MAIIHRFRYLCRRKRAILLNEYEYEGFDFQASPRANGNTAWMAEEYCHNQGNGACIQKDDMQELYPLMAERQSLLCCSSGSIIAKGSRCNAQDSRLAFLHTDTLPIGIPRLDDVYRHLFGAAMQMKRMGYHMTKMN